jgi:hypothetical protein
MQTTMLRRSGKILTGVSLAALAFTATPCWPRPLLRLRKPQTMAD